MAKKKMLVVNTGQSLATRPAARPITEEGKGYARTAVRLKVARTIWTLWDNLREHEGVDQTWLVERLDSNKGRVSRLLNNPGNWTLDTVADLLEAMEARLTLVQAKRYRDVDAASTVDPSLAGLRDSPRLWSVIDQNVESAGTEMLEPQIPTPTKLRSMASLLIVPSEPK